MQRSGVNQIGTHHDIECGAVVEQTRLLILAPIEWTQCRLAAWGCLVGSVAPPAILVSCDGGTERVESATCGLRCHDATCAECCHCHGAHAKTCAQLHGAAADDSMASRAHESHGDWMAASQAVSTKGTGGSVHAAAGPLSAKVREGWARLPAEQKWQAITSSTRAPVTGGSPLPS